MVWFNLLRNLILCFVFQFIFLLLLFCLFSSGLSEVNLWYRFGQLCFIIVIDGMVWFGMVLYLFFFQLVMLNGMFSLLGVLCRVGISIRFFFIFSMFGVILFMVWVIFLKMFQLLCDFYVGFIVFDSGWMKGCMFEVLRLFFLYQVVVGSMMFEYSVVVYMWKLSVISRFSLFFGVLLCYFIFCGFIVFILFRFLFCSLWCVFSRCCSMYLWFLFEELSRFECQMNIMCGWFWLVFGLVKVKFSELFLNLFSVQLVGVMLVVLVLCISCSGLWFSCGVFGSQFMCIVCRFRLVRLLLYLLVLVSGDSSLFICSFLQCYCLVLKQKNEVLFMWCGGLFQFRLNVSGCQLVCGCSFFWFM